MSNYAYYGIGEICMIYAFGWTNTMSNLWVQQFIANLCNEENYPIDVDIIWIKFDLIVLLF